MVDRQTTQTKDITPNLKAELNLCVNTNVDPLVLFI